MIESRPCFGVGVGICGRVSAGGVSVDGVGMSTSCCLSVWDKKILMDFDPKNYTVVVNSVEKVCFGVLL